ncbi:precorrin-4 C(11)-methyltransferase [Chlorobium phaeovibrioides]|uniref:Precorrin-4 C(11)-methyltransferase n=1 Tax=Chlorobium phaeovibrioides TaxID=1094 RepID=A0A5M8IAM5_CHLPH|nr:precorrin-4 C(11)-methyltransferase [Chlorobium phaeovibrioides]KAA6232421.1 precorrin-4 C(11)-methyltransferase [Chlorobium phaeovibrioides]MWV55013.1 precorrin-4 C(11)-methyltransferase [Chlorobium phaeovibrioides]QEQ57079.1 precorrin-4 C(11)-methyltransferase [Chlorobium phaeovibrioides]
MDFSLAIIAASDGGIRLGKTLQSLLSADGGFDCRIFSAHDAEGVSLVESIPSFVKESFHRFDAFLFIGSLGICVRSIAPVLESKQKDPAVLNCDEAGRFVQPVISGHIGGGNALALRVSRMLGAEAVLTTSSDVQGLWPLDILGREDGWTVEFSSPLNGESITTAMASFVNHEPAVLLLETRDAMTDRLERSAPAFVKVVSSYDEIDFAECRLLLAVTPRLFESPVRTVFYRPKVLCLGLGSERGIDPVRFLDSIGGHVAETGFSLHSLKAVGTVDFKMNEVAFLAFADARGLQLQGFAPDRLSSVASVPNPSEVVFAKTGIYSVSEAASALLAGNEKWLVQKQKVAIKGLPEGRPRHFTFAISLLQSAAREGRIAIVGAGPGDPELVTIRGKEYLEQGDLILYAGSLVPEKLTWYAKQGALVRSSATMSLEEQFELMAEFYRKGKFIVRLHTGDPSIYGAIQEQMAYFDREGMVYEIVPGVSSFQAAAALLKSQFTVPEKVQTIILTRGNGRTPVPEKEKLSELARARATMCIYLSAEWGDEVQSNLLEHYPSDTPVAICYRIGWDDQQVWTGELSGLAELIRQSGKSRQIMIVVGEAIGARINRSKLYDPAFAHGFRSSRSH